RSTKVDTLIKLLGWQLESDDHHVFPVDEDDTMTEAAVAAKALTPPPPNQLADSILVYIEFPMMAPLLISVLQLHNIYPLVIHGGHGAEERNEIVLKFHSDPKARILIFSSVGAVGLNLTAASVVVLFDQCWSRMLVNQIIGRAWRLGQQKEVVVYNMVALGTVDVLMLHHGEGKGNMLRQFLSANQGTR
ncbi:P-loop containing nucleoside triphosphate hydrolase protein, partial [Suillus tomentosus]